jgi:hypothetical protein
MSNLIAALKKHKAQALALDDLQHKLADVQRAYNWLDNARAKLEEVQDDLRDLEHPEFENELLDLSATIDDWLGALHPIGEDMLDWSGRPEDDDKVNRVSLKDWSL